MQSLQKKIVKSLGVKSIINVQEEIRKIIDFLKSYLKHHLDIITLIVGISGGQDSTLTGKLSQLAITELRKETNNNDYKFIAVRMPYGIQIDEKDCKDAVNFIKPDHLLIVDIKEAVLASELSLRKAGINISDFIKGNMKARERMKIQYSIAGISNGIVVGTDHSAEYVTGFFTKYGDGGTDINPIFHLNKRQGKQLLDKLHCPKHLLLKKPTADLEDNRPGLKDETVLGVTYKSIDDYLEGKDIKSHTSKVIEYWYKKTIHKRNLPITIFNNFLEEK